MTDQIKDTVQKYASAIVMLLMFTGFTAFFEYTTPSKEDSDKILTACRENLEAIHENLDAIHENRDISLETLTIYKTRIEANTKKIVE